MQTLTTHYRPLQAGEKIDTLFLFQAGTVWPSLDTVYRSCLEDCRFNVRLVLVTETTVEKSHMFGAKNFLEEKGLTYELYEDIDFELYCPHVVFIQFPYDAACHTPETLSIQFKRRGSRVVYVPYGIEISDTEIARKDHFASFVVENCWRLYTSSEKIKAEYDKYCRNRRAVRVTGSPKFDAISTKEMLPLKEEIINAANGRPILVWKMHFPKKINEGGVIKQITPYMTEYLEFVEYVANCSDLFFILLAHPKMLRGVVDSDVQGDANLMKQVQDLIEKCRGLENIYIDGSDDYRNSFYHADGIIMDRSAVVIEAAMLDVPVLLMKNEEYSEPMTTPVEEVCDSLEQGNTCHHMMEFVENFKKGLDTKRSVRKETVDKNFPFLDGKCGERIKNDILQSLQESAEGGKLKVAVYGTGEISRYYMETGWWFNQNIFESVMVVDSNPDKWGKDFFGHKIFSPNNLVHSDIDAIVIMTEPHYFEIKKSLVYDYYIDERIVWRLDEFVVAVDEFKKTSEDFS